MLVDHPSSTAGPAPKLLFEARVLMIHGDVGTTVLRRQVPPSSCPNFSDPPSSWRSGNSRRQLGSNSRSCERQMWADVQAWTSTWPQLLGGKLRLPEISCVPVWMFVCLFQCICLCWVLVTACRIFRYCIWTLMCSMWDLVPWPRMEPRPLHWERRVLVAGSPGKRPVWSVLCC